ncbi:MAG: LysR family transcriptional regulator [Kordiimonadales bacterium]|nr:MAG: LysR family transcriptional regulator [Kordiimonadales bacterium]
MDTIEGMKTFVTVAKEASFTAAAKRLNISNKLASKYVQQLEERLGAQLLQRSTRRVSLTDVGQAYLQRCLPLLEEFDELEAVVQERQGALAGEIRLTASTSFGSGNLVEAMRPFLLEHPDVTVDLYLSDRRVSIIEEGFDLAIRLGQLTDSSLMVRKLNSMPLLVCVSPDYLRRHGEPQHPKALETHNCVINYGLVDPTNWIFNVEGVTEHVKVSGPSRTNTPLAVAGMASAGLGIGLCPEYVVTEKLRTGELVVLFEEFTVMEAGVYAVYPPNRHLTSRVRALIDHLAREMR